MSSNRIKGQEIQLGDSFVLPIEQSRVTSQQAKVQKIIAETDARVQQLLSQADNKSQIIVQAANTEAETIIQNARKKGEQEYEAVKNQAYEEGFKKGEEDGLEKFKKDALEALQSLETLASSSFDTKKNIIDSATSDIVDLVSAISDKICHAQFDEKILKKITLDAIDLLNDKEQITIIVNPKLVENINSYVPDFKEKITKLQSLKIIEDSSISADGVIVETPEQRLDARISTQIEEITQKMLTSTEDDVE